MLIVRILNDMWLCVWCACLLDISALITIVPVTSTNVQAERLIILNETRACKVK